MSLARPPHLVSRQMGGRAFSEPLVILRTSGARDKTGEWTETETREETTCATAPAGTSGSSGGRVRQLMEGGVRLDAMRDFWTVEDLRPAVEEASDGTGGSAGDIVVFEGERYRIDSTARWGGFSESLGIRQEGQG